MSDPWEEFGEWDGETAATVALADSLLPNVYRSDPSGWVEDRLDGHFWSKQREVATSVVENRYTAVPSCHDAGKSYAAAKLILWWIDCYGADDAFVVWTAPTYPQVNAILGREIRRTLRDFPELGLKLLGDNQLVTTDDEPILVGYGRKPSDYNPAAFQGIHAKHVLVVLDEAAGIPRSLWDAVDALVTSEGSRVLAIGNPDDPGSHFARVCDPGDRLGDGWNVIRIDGYRTPNFTEERIPDRLRDLLLSPAWVEERRRRWGEDSAIYRAKVRGEFAESSDDSVIPYAMAKAALGYSDDWSPDAPGVLGCDIARGGADESTIVAAHCGRAEIVARFREADLMKTSDRIAGELEKRGPRWKAVVDGDGLGGGVIDRLKQLKLPVVEYRGSGRARNRPRRFANRRAEAWWAVRELLADGAIELPDGTDDADTLLRDLTVPQVERDAAGRIKLESKDEIRKRLGASPDLGDALVMALSEPPGRHIEPIVERRGDAAITAGLLVEAM